MHPPISHRLTANGLLHHVLEWAPASPHAVVVLLHGYMDAAGSWDLVVPHLTGTGFRVFAPDLRGFGRTARVPDGGYYHFPDYIADLADVADALVGDTPFSIVGHSMGGSIATMYAGAFPGRVTRLALLEGVGPPDNPFDVAPHRMRRWIEAVRAVRTQGDVHKTVGAREDAYRRLVLNHPGVDAAVLRQRLDHLVRDLGDGSVVWRFDSLHKTLSPSPFYAKQFMAFARRIACPVLAVSGGAQGFHPADEEVRLGAFRVLERAEIPDAGHMMHWTRPEVLGPMLAEFLRAP